MHSPAAAIAWEFHGRHRWGLRAVAGYILVLAFVRFFVVPPGTRIEFADAQNFALAVVVPITSSFLYFLAVFTFGLSGDIAGRQSMYPSRMFTLPVTTAALAGWPMLYGTATVIVLWLSTRLLSIWPSNAEIPVYWPALLAASLLAWTQALTWMPYPLRGLRVALTMVWLAVIDAIVLIALELKASETTMLLLLAPHVPLAYFAAKFAVSRARRGDVPDWTLFARSTVAAVRRPFASAARAQEWFEWRQHGRSLPILVAIILPLALSMLFLFSDTPVVVGETLVAVLLTPPLMATFVAASAGSGFPPFLATRPMSDVALIAPKLKVAMWSTLAAWMLVILAIPIALQWSGTTYVVTDVARGMSGTFGVPRAIAIAALVLVTLVLSTWKRLVQSLYIGMSGRPWMVKTSVFGTLVLLAVGVPLLMWILENRAATARVWSALPWLLVSFAGLKLVAASMVATRLYDSKLLSARTLVLVAISWNVLVFALYGLMLWIVPELVVRSYVIVLVAILMVPFARVSAAPLALAWNRHR